MPGGGHWGIFADLIAATGATGADLADAHLAAPAIEPGGEWVTPDRGFSRRPGLRRRSPLDAP